jgi:hypothetical protein
MSGGFFVHLKWSAQFQSRPSYSTHSSNFTLALPPTRVHLFLMKSIFLSLLLASPCFATTISVVPIYEPLTLHGTDTGDIITDIGEALQATVMSRPMALTGAIPEALVDAIRTPHPIPTNAPNYKVKEANLLVLCNLTLAAKMTEEGMDVVLDVSKLTIPEDIDMTSRQLIRITFAALQKTLEEYQSQQTQPLHVQIKIEGTTEKNATLKELEATFIVPPAP